MDEAPDLLTFDYTMDDELNDEGDVQVWLMFNEQRQSLIYNIDFFY